MDTIKGEALNKLLNSGELKTALEFLDQAGLLDDVEVDIRAIKAEKEAEKEKTRNDAAIKIQSLGRGQIAKGELKKLNKEKLEKDSAITIQSTRRRQIATRQVQVKKYENCVEENKTHINSLNLEQLNKYTSELNSKDSITTEPLRKLKEAYNKLSELKPETGDEVKQLKSELKGSISTRRQELITALTTSIEESIGKESRLETLTTLFQEITTGTESSRLVQEHNDVGFLDEDEVKQLKSKLQEPVSKQREQLIEKLTTSMQTSIGEQDSLETLTPLYQEIIKDDSTTAELKQQVPMTQFLIGDEAKKLKSKLQEPVSKRREQLIEKLTKEMTDKLNRIEDEEKLATYKEQLEVKKYEEVTKRHIYIKRLFRS